MIKFNQWKDKNHFGILTFGLTFFTMLLVFIPFLAYNKGMFVFLGDYNVQQVPFYQLAHRAIHEGSLRWNWYTDLGVNFLGSYSFYLLFSPFFWLTLPFPNDFLPYLMAPLLMLKTALAATTAYYYIKRFLKEEMSAVIGGLLYAFSGFMMFNIFFNHFHDVVVFFPLLLISLEELVENQRKGFFALMVMVSAVVNYWFFIGEVVFVIIYVFTRISTGGWGITLRKFLIIALESIAGVLMAAVVLLPSALAIMDNPRTSADSLLTGWLMWIYGFNQRLPAIISSLFFPPELPSQPNFFPDQGAKWSSMSAYLPLFSTVGVIAYIKERKQDFVKRLMLISLFMACFPVLNSAFVLFNSSYYARWFYMPILFMCLATAWVFEQGDLAHIHSGLKWTAGITAFITIAVGFSPVKVDDELTFGLYEYGFRFWCYVFVAMLGLVLTYYIFFHIVEIEKRQKVAAALVCVLSCSFLWGYIASGKGSLENDNWYINWVVGGADNLQLPDDGYVRSDFYESSDNLGMFWEQPNIQAFHSIIPPSTMNFYIDIGIKRDVSSKPPIAYSYLRSLLSVKWLFVPSNIEEQPPIEGYTLYSTQNGYNIYENPDYLPMGFGYTQYVTDEVLDGFSGVSKSEVLLHYLHLSDEDALRNNNLGTIVSDISLSDLGQAGMEEAIAQRRQLAVDSFMVTNTGFEATTSYDQECLVFFSVPYDEGWTATIDGEEIPIYCGNLGFLTIPVPDGSQEIVFTYLAPGLEEGFYLSILGFALLLICIFAPLHPKNNVTPIYFGDGHEAMILEAKNNPPMEEDEIDLLIQSTLSSLEDDPLDEVGLSVERLLAYIIEDEEEPILKKDNIVPLSFQMEPKDEEEE